ncbi:25669_t:CDS:2, partial [Dentiscutata erythropus]
RALELFRSCLTGEASRWVEDKLIANMAVVVALNNANITATMINAPDGTLLPALPGGATGATVILAHNVHMDKDWSLAGGCPVDTGTATNALNGVLNNNNYIVLPDINIRSDLVRDYYRKIDKYASWARISNCEKRIQFIRGLFSENKLELKRLGLNRPLNDDLIETLEQIEIEKNDMLLEDVDRIVNSKIQALQQSTLNQSPASSSGQKNITKADLQAIAKSLQETMSRATKTLDNSKKSANKRVENTAVICFLSDLLKKKPYIHPADKNNHDPVDDISDSLVGLTLNSVINTAIKRLPKTSLEETIRKILQNELKSIFPDHFFQNSIKANIPNQPSLFQEKIKSQSNTSSIAKIIPNVHTLKDIKNRGHRLGSVYEQELEKKLNLAIEYNSKINDLSEELQAKISEYSEQKEKFHQINAVVKNKISQIDAVNTRLRSQITSEWMSQAILAQKASSLDKIKILSLEAKIGELEAEVKHLELERVGSPSHASQGSGETGKRGFKFKKHEIECIEKGIEATDVIYKRELDRLSSVQLNLIEENSYLQGLVLKKDNETVPEGSAEHVLPFTSDAKEKESEQVLKESQLSTLNPPPSQIFSLGGAEAESLLTTTLTIVGFLMMPMIIYSILTLLLIAII